MDRCFDWALGATAMSFAVQALVRGAGSDLVSGTILVLNVTVGLLFLRRRQPKKTATLRECLICFASVPLSALALALAPPEPAWPVAARVLFAASGAGAVVSLVALGKSFAVLPSLRGVVQRGPFELIRHPVYGCELLMLLICASVSAHSLWFAPPVLAVGLVVLRIRIEEQLLDGELDYRAYRQRVRWRLLPGIW